MLTIFYDAKCPLCTTEMNHLKEYDKNNVITLVDLHQQDFANLYPEIKFIDAMNILHGAYNGKLLLGLEVTHRAWTLVGKGFWVAPLNWPVIKQLSHWVYLGLAKYRHPISTTLAKAFPKLFDKASAQCRSGTCYNDSKK
ncbi:MAG: putative DCC family thiol-disulfide oxidoreductase YuxK [Paraglaciecola sp.]|jgi:predicted DCC family thiol-disulfide oxidoreductase YuxK